MPARETGRVIPRQRTDVDKFSLRLLSVPFQLPISFEFFPPRTEEQELILDSTCKLLTPLAPEYLSVTFGAGGSTLSATRKTVLRLQQETGISAAPHISCMAPDRQAVLDLLNEYRAAGVDRLVVLRGDRPSGVSGPGPFQYANELVSFVRRETGDHFHIEVACYPEFHPESDCPDTEMQFFRKKVEAGADGAITQYFFNADSYFRFRDDCERRGIDVPITPGIMPITNFKQLARFSDMCGAEIPMWIRKRLEAYGDDGAAIREFGTEVVSRLCERLVRGGVPALHFYTLNRANATLRILKNLKSV